MVFGSLQCPDQWDLPIINTVNRTSFVPVAIQGYVYSFSSVVSMLVVSLPLLILEGGSCESLWGSQWGYSERKWDHGGRKVKRSCKPGHVALGCRRSLMLLAAHPHAEAKKCHLFTFSFDFWMARWPRLPHMADNGELGNTPAFWCCFPEREQYRGTTEHCLFLCAHWSDVLSCFL